jgi:membrane-associated phospholipid phosphatase
MSSRAFVLAFYLWAAVLGGAIVLSVFAAKNDTLPGDRTLTEWLQEQSLPGQDVSDFVRAVTTTETVMATGAALSVVLWLRGYRRQAILLGLGLGVLAIAQFGTKEIVDRPRPEADRVDIRAGGSSPSFPAGHVMSGTVLYGFLVYLALTLPIARGAAIVLAIGTGLLIVLVGPVNVWVGVHWPSDVLGGYVWAVVILLPLLGLDLWRRDGEAKLSKP